MPQSYQSDRLRDPAAGRLAPRTSLRAPAWRNRARAVGRNGDAGGLGCERRFLGRASDILAVADGEGRNGVWLAEQGHRVTAVDISERGQAKAARLAAARGVGIELITADLNTWAWPAGRFDAVIAIFIQFAGPIERERLFHGIKQATRPGGRLLLQGYRPEQLAFATGGPSDVANLYTGLMLRAAFDDWVIEHLAEHDSPLAEGAGHNGMSALIDLVARKPG